MDNKEVTQEGGPKESHSLPLGSLRREMDSLDDFEHLGHDSSPLKESGTGDLLSGLKTAARDELGMINKGDDKAATAANPAELSSFDPLQSALFDRKMDSNLLEMGDNFPDRKEGDAKLDKFLEEMTSFAPPKHEEPPEIPDKDDGKTATQHFMDVEREPIQPKKPDATNDLLEKYSDSEPDNDDDFKPSKYEDFPKKAELPESFGSTDNFKTDAFKDLDELEPQLPQKDYPLEPAPAPPKEVKPEPVKTTPEPAKKLPEKEEVCKADSKPKKAAVIDAEAIFCKMGLDTWFNPERLNPKVESLIYWRDPKKSGPVFGGILLVLLALTYFSLISVVAYLSLLGLTGTISFRIYKNIVQAVQKTGDGHPFKEFLELDVSLPQNKVKEVSEVAVAHINAAVVELRRLFLVEDLVDSIKFGVLLWTLTYLGAWFNGMTLIIIAWVALFTLPKVYEANKTQIDANLEIVRTKLAEITSKVKAAIPIGKKAEEKKEQ
ncbi:reticulon-1 isoform X1 [Tenebrio molitor]|uniref:reticulon-1 isoform X1 n=1 Tax=Tenebrio molitor TaxID=7067 RepID=UPI0036249900